MSFPDLPRTLKKREADITPRVVKWFEKNWPRSVALEIKIKGGKMRDHQKVALTQVASGVFSHKIPDTGRRNPFDAFVLKNADAFIVVCEGTTCVGVPMKKGGKYIDIHI